eukprot:gene16324-17963_t
MDSSGNAAEEEDMDSRSSWAEQADEEQPADISPEHPLPITSVRSRPTLITIPFASPDISNEQIFQELHQYGKIINIWHQTYPEFPTISTGKRLCTIYPNPENPLPPFIIISGQKILISFRGRQPVCMHCNSKFHMTSSCHLRGQKLCFHCGQDDHHYNDCDRRHNGYPPTAHDNGRPRLSSSGSESVMDSDNDIDQNSDKQSDELSDYHDSLLIKRLSDTDDSDNDEPLNKVTEEQEQNVTPQNIDSETIAEDPDHLTHSSSSTQVSSFTTTTLSQSESLSLSQVQSLASQPHQSIDQQSRKSINSTKQFICLTYLSIFTCHFLPESPVLPDTLASYTNQKRPIGTSSSTSSTIADNSRTRSKKKKQKK